LTKSLSSEAEPNKEKDEMLIHSHPILSRFLIWVVLPIILVLSLGYGFLLQSLPQKEGILRLQGLDSPVKIIRDEHAVPHIFAAADHDAFFALGYLHAQDRLWQMNYMRRLGQGRLSEILGRDALNNDRLMRTLGLSRAAQTDLESLNESARQSLIAYTNGVNAWLKEGNILPVEFYILDTEPELWQPIDSLLIIKLVAFNLGFNYQRELSLDLLVKELGVAKANELIPNVNSENSSITEATDLADPSLIQGLLAQNDQLRRQYHMRGEGVGSNAWAVSGKFTKSGLPLFASDPHLGVEIPAVWYLAEIQGDRLHVTGATYPGIPFVFMGHNESIAWGTTNMFADAQDLYLERTNPLNENQYEVDGQWLDMEVDEELIYIKSDFPRFLTDPIPPLKWEVRRTRHGPLISDIMGQADYPLALRWAGLDEQDKTYQSYLNINYAEDWTSFKSAFEGYAVPAINFVYADTHGDIGLFAAGKIPIRRHGDGRLPVPGWQSIYDWNGYIPLEQLPQILNPEKGYIVNANNKNHSADYPYLVANNWGLPYRAERIHQTIQSSIKAGRKLDIHNFIDMQGDVQSLQFKELLPFFQNLSPQTTQQKEIINKLKQWDGVLSEESKEAAIYQVWLRHFNVLLLGDDLRGSLLHEARGDELQDFVETIVQLRLISQVIRQNQSLQYNWCDQISTAAQESCEELALIALDEASKELDRFIGTEKQWGDIHKTNYPHRAFTNTRLLDFVFDRSTVNAGTWFYSEDREYEIVTSSSYRQVIDLSEWNKSGFINSTGQSGNVLSEHYDDNILPFKQLALWPMHFGMEQSSGKESILKLLPIK
jgi:penicillin G amidase